MLCMHADAILSSIFSKLQYSVFDMKKDYEQGICLCDNFSFMQ